MPGEQFREGSDIEKQFSRAVRAFDSAEAKGFDFDAFPGADPPDSEQTDAHSAFTTEKFDDGLDDLRERVGQMDGPPGGVEELKGNSDAEAIEQLGLNSEEKADLLLAMVSEINDNLTAMRGA